MIRCIFLSLFVVSALLPNRAQIDSKQGDFPSVSVLLPANISSETVQISYFLIGPFGGYGDYTRAAARFTVIRDSRSSRRESSARNSNDCLCVELRD